MAGEVGKWGVEQVPVDRHHTSVARASVARASVARAMMVPVITASGTPPRDRPGKPPTAPQARHQGPGHRPQAVDQQPVAVEVAWARFTVKYCHQAGGLHSLARGRRAALSSRPACQGSRDRTAHTRPRHASRSPPTACPVGPAPRIRHRNARPRSRAVAAASAALGAAHLQHGLSGGDLGQGVQGRTAPPGAICRAAVADLDGEPGIVDDGTGNACGLDSLSDTTEARGGRASGRRGREMGGRTGSCGSSPYVGGSGDDGAGDHGVRNPLPAIDQGCRPRRPGHVIRSSVPKCRRGRCRAAYGAATGHPRLHGPGRSPCPG